MKMILANKIQCNDFLKVEFYMFSSLGGGSVFGPDVTENVFERNNLKLLIRSHECKEEGFEYTHKGNVSSIILNSFYSPLWP